RSNKKKDVINTLYNLITPPKNENLNSDLKFKLHRFEQLKCLANPSHRDQFKIHVHSQETNKNKYTLSIKKTMMYIVLSPKIIGNLYHRYHLLSYH
ncbi:TPA: pathogenicity island 1 protein SopD2, partial [Yersinia enterocolitica]|nr:pathogenicity island 1 protein SopD2 [Yersinia enterocolitica]